MIRVVLAAVLATALLGATLPVAERAERDRNAALATGELQRLADRASRLAADNDPVARGRTPAAATLVVASPRPRVTDRGRLLVADDRLEWQLVTGPTRPIQSPVPIRVVAPIRVADRAHLRLSLVRADGAPVVRVERARVET